MDIHDWDRQARAPVPLRRALHVVSQGALIEAPIAALRPR